MAISRIQLGITVSSPVSAATVVIPVSAVSWINIVIGAEVDYLGRNPVVREISLVVDTLVWDIGKVLAEDARITDTHASLFGSHKADASAVGDKAVLGHEKVLAEYSTVGEIASRQFGKSLQDYLTVTDDIDGIASIEDDQEMQLGKTVTDIAQLSDNLSRQVNFRRALDEYAIDYFLEGFVETNTARVTDDLARVVVYHRAYTEASTATDTVSRGVSKPLTHAAAFADSIARQAAFRRGMNDAGTVSDFTVRTAGKTISDTSQLTDVLFRSIGAFQVDSAKAVEVVIRHTSKGVPDNAGVAEVFSRQAAFQRGMGDTTRSTDALICGLGKDISSYALDYFGQDFMDNHAVGTTDVLSRSLGAVRADSARISATGLLTWQSFGADYFQGDYVGAAQTF